MKLGIMASVAVVASLIAASRADEDCGAKNQAPCATEGAECNEGLVVYTYIDAESETAVAICSPCGIWNRLPCTAEGVEPCSSGLAVDAAGKCVGCGYNRRPACTRENEEPCNIGSYEDAGYCYACGVEGAEFCQGQNKCLPGYTPKLDGTLACTRCGLREMPACSNPNEAACGNGLGANAEGVCDSCGTNGKPGCAESCEPCRTSLTPGEDGLCTYCGWAKRPWCTNMGEDICRAGTTPASDGTCQPCGSGGRDQCGIVGSHIAEFWEFDGESGESFDLTGTALSFKPVNDEQYRVTKEPRTSFFGGAQQSESIDRDVVEPIEIDLDFDFPFYDTTYSKVCLSTQGHLVFPDAEGAFTGCEIIPNDTPLTLETHYSAKRISFSFDHWAPDCKTNGLGCIRASSGTLEDGRKFLAVRMMNVADVSNDPGYKDGINQAQVQLRIMDDGEIKTFYRWSRSKDGIVGLSPGFQPLSFNEVNFSGEFCRPGSTPLADGTCATCGGRNQPICENSKADKPCKNNYAEGVEEDGKTKTGICVRCVGC